jgi:hypothetical protein
MKPPKPQPLDEIEMRPDAWERFERAVDAAVRHGPVTSHTTQTTPYNARAEAQRLRRKKERADKSA